MRAKLFVAALLGGSLLAAQEASSISLEKEAALGRHLAAKYRSQMMNDSVVQSYLDRLSQRIAAHVGKSSFSFTVSAITDDPCRTTHEPVDLPGGYIFVPAALFTEAQNEAEFTGMLAQAMQRIVLRDGVRRWNQYASLATIPLIFMGNGCSESEIIPLVQKSEGLRADPSLVQAEMMQADALVVPALAQAGFDPEALLQYLERVQPAHSGSIVYTALPNRQARAENIRYAVELQPQSDYIVDESDFVAVKQRVLGLTEHPATVRPMPSLGPQ